MLESVSVAVDEGAQVVEEDDGDGLQVEKDEGDGLYVEEAVVAEKRSIKRRIKIIKLITYYKLGQQGNRMR